MNQAATINIWSLEKEQDIKALLLLLTQQIAQQRIAIVEEALPSSAIRLTPNVDEPDVSVYLYTYAQPEGCYGVDLEYPLKMAREADDQTVRLNELNEDQALEHIIMHLELL